MGRGGNCGRFDPGQRAGVRGGALTDQYQGFPVANDEFFFIFASWLLIDQITRTARRISAEDLSARLNLPPADDEVGRLAATFDTMPVRLDNAFQRERQFTADASHELRTPLTTMQTILSTTLTRPRAPTEYDQALSDLAEETGRMKRLL